MKHLLPVVLIGPCEEDPTESVSQVNRCFIAGLATRYEFVPHVANRTFGGTRRSRLNPANAWFFLRHWALWKSRLQEHQPAIVHYAINSGWALEKSLAFLASGQRAGARTVGHLHSGSFLDFWSGLSDWRKRRAARSLAGLDALVVLSEAWKQRVVDQLGLDPGRVHVVNNPLDPAFEEKALAMPVERAGVTMLALGVMDEQKGVLDLVRAAAMAREQSSFTLVLAGPERQPGIRARVEKLVAEHHLQDSVRLQAGVWGAEKVRLFRDAAAFVLPSYFENFPLVVLEAAASGLPMIVTPVGATAEFFQREDSALYVQPGDVDGLAAALVRVADSLLLRRRLGQRARAVFVERLARERIMNSLATVYDTVLGTVSRGGVAVPEVSRTG